MEYPFDTEDMCDTDLLGLVESKDRLAKADWPELISIATKLGVDDTGCDNIPDFVERILVTIRKKLKNSHPCFAKFSDVEEEFSPKRDTLLDIVSNLETAFSSISTEALSGILRKEKLLKNKDLLADLKARKNALHIIEWLVVIAGETNGGKSSLLNVVLGKDILPTDVLHCTFAITKIKYSHSYSIETLDVNDRTQTFSFDNLETARDKLKALVAEENPAERILGTMYKEITLHMPSPILQCGVTLVDTPGIGEDEKMDDVTMNYIRSTRASAFIYVIKSDHAGGIQEDRLVAFLQAIQDDFKNDGVTGAIDPQAAMFICNRWDMIENVEMVKKNALTKLDTVWPGFEPEQLHFFSSIKAQLHLDIDPEFVTDNLNNLVTGMERLFKRAAHNSIYHQYRWAKVFLQLASRHLRSMIHHCIKNNEDLEQDFRSLATKQEKLMTDSREKSANLQDSLTGHKEKLKQEVCSIFTNIQCEDLEDYEWLKTMVSGDRFLLDRQNRHDVEQWVVSSLIHCCDRAIQESEVYENMESETKKLIKEHFGLFEDQIKDCLELVKGKPEKQKAEQRRGSESTIYGASCNSLTSTASASSFNLSELCGDSLQPTQLNQAVEKFLGKKRKSHFFKSMPKIKKAIQEKLQAGTLSKSVGKNYDNPIPYLDFVIRKNASLMKDNEEIVEGFVAGYIRLHDMYIKAAIDRIPHFIEVNTELMENIREHRRAFQDDKVKMKAVMEQLEPCREELRGYGLLYMEDVVANLIGFETERRNSNVNISDTYLSISCRPNDSGFVGSGSSRSRVRGFWVYIRSAVISIDSSPIDVTLRAYTCHIDKMQELSEIAHLRSLEHPNIAPFFGMTRIASSNDRNVNSNNNNNRDNASADSSARISTFIFKGSLVAARVFKSNKLINFREFVRNFLIGLLSGLEFIHRENLVHLELNLDTVMVDFATGNVQLCQQCLPREIQLPSDLSIKTDASVCLSPSVLQGNKYDICDDMYAFGLLLWELLFPDNKPFSEQRGWPLEEFIEKVNPTQMLGPEISELKASDAVKNVLKGLLLKGRGKICMAMAEVRSFLDGVSNDPAVKTIAGKNKRHAGMKRDSKEKSSVEGEDGNEAPNGGPVRPPRPKREARRDVWSWTTIPPVHGLLGLPPNDPVRRKSSSDIPELPLPTTENQNEDSRLNGSQNESRGMRKNVSFCDSEQDKHRRDCEHNLMVSVQLTQVYGSPRLSRRNFFGKSGSVDTPSMLVLQQPLIKDSGGAKFRHEHRPEESQQSPSIDEKTGDGYRPMIMSEHTRRTSDPSEQTVADIHRSRDRNRKVSLPCAPSITITQHGVGVTRAATFDHSSPDEVRLRKHGQKLQKHQLQKQSNIDGDATIKPMGDKVKSFSTSVPGDLNNSCDNQSENKKKSGLFSQILSSIQGRRSVSPGQIIRMPDERRNESATCDNELPNTGDIAGQPQFQSDISSKLYSSIKNDIIPEEKENSNSMSSKYSPRPSRSSSHRTSLCDTIRCKNHSSNNGRGSPRPTFDTGLTNDSDIQRSFVAALNDSFQIPPNVSFNPSKDIEDANRGYVDAAVGIPFREVYGASDSTNQWDDGGNFDIPTMAVTHPLWTAGALPDANHNKAEDDRFESNDTNGGSLFNHELPTLDFGQMSFMNDIDNTSDIFDENNN